MENSILFKPCVEGTIINGASKVGSIEASYADLCNMFGKPAFEGKGDKVTTEFVIDYEWYDNDEDATYGGFVLYDWCYGRDFNDDYKKITWNIGGKGFNDSYAASLALKIFEQTDIRFAFDDFYAACLAHANWHELKDL
tara:strand:- start:586 stop:1002 length:417 start_codon:yes stop_codon:yes gene_type:complete